MKEAQVSFFSLSHDTSSKIHSFSFVHVTSHSTIITHHNPSPANSRCRPPSPATTSRPQPPPPCPLRKWELRCCCRRYELCCCHWRGESCCCHWRTESCSGPCCHCSNRSPHGEGEGRIRHHPKYHSWWLRFDCWGDGGGRGGRAHKEIIESKHFKIYLSNFSC